MAPRQLISSGQAALASMASAKASANAPALVNRWAGSFAQVTVDELDREHVGRRVLLDVIGRFVREPACDTTHDPIEDREHVSVGRHRVHHEPEAVAVLDDYAVGNDDVKMDVEIDQTANRCTNVTAPVSGASTP
jgi:hypothetical protein